MRRGFLQLSAGNTVSKVLGVVREILLARFFGTGAVADAYRASLSLTLSPAHLITQRVIQTSFIPLYARYYESDKRKAGALFQSLMVAFLGAGILIGIALYLASPSLIKLIVPGFGEDRFELAVAMVRILAFGVPAYIYCSVLSALGIARNDFLIPSLRPGFQNVGLILGIAAAARYGNYPLLAWGFTAGYVLLALVATTHLVRRRLLPLEMNLEADLIREVWGRLWVVTRPLILVAILAESNVLVERFVASLIGPGRVAAADYARFVTETAHTLLTVPLGIVSLSYFATMKKNDLAVRNDLILSALLLIFIPLSAFLLVNGDAVIRILFFRGEFDTDSLALTSRALIGFSAGLWVFTCAYYLQRVHSARLQNSIVLRGDALFFLVNLAINLLLYQKLGLLVLGIANGVGAACAAIYYLRKLDLDTQRATRTLAGLAVVLPVYMIAAYVVRGLAGQGVPSLLLQLGLATLIWGGIILLRPEWKETIRSAVRGKRE